jgi:hypothetical protein
VATGVAVAGVGAVLPVVVLVAGVPAEPAAVVVAGVTGAAGPLVAGAPDVAVPASLPPQPAPSAVTRHTDPHTFLRFIMLHVSRERLLSARAKMNWITN